jgi:phage major head subunit gpT-like protein
MAISRAQMLKELIPGLNKLFGMTYKRYAEQWRAMFEVQRSDRSFEEEVKLSGFALPSAKEEGASIAYDEAQEAWTARYVHQTVAMGFAITEEAIEDNLYDSLATRYTKAMARSMAYAKNVRGANIFNNGFNSSFPGGDGVSLFSTAHPLIGGGVNANRPATGVDLNETAIEAGVIQMAKWTDERGLLVAAKPQKLIVPQDLDFVATRLLRSELRTTLSAVNTFAPNDVNAMVVNSTFPGGYVVNNFLTDVNAWFMMTDVEDGLKYFQRVSMKTSSEGDFDTGNIRYKARERYSFGWSDPLAVWGSPGST